jgi:DNA-binding NarL/FixJ family response regulator
MSLAIRMLLIRNCPPPSPASDVWDEVIESLCKSGGLSPRQREILPYLAKGRDAHYLENRFVISHATAKSHIYSIYRKLGVHSRQELIDLVESLQNMKNDSNQ